MKSTVKTFVSALLLLAPLLFSVQAHATNWGDDDDDHDDRGWGWGSNYDHDWGRDWDRDDNHDWDKDWKDDWSRKWNGSWKEDLDEWKRKGWGYSHSNKVFICHRTSSSKNPYVFIQVDASAKQAHYDHGDPVQFTDKGNGNCGPTTPAPVQPVVTLTLAAAEIAVGATTTISWTSTNATSCTLEANGRTTTVALNASAVAVGPYTSTGSKTITITCKGSGNTSDTESKTLKVKAAPAPNVSLSLSPTEIVEDTGKTTATWTSTNATSCKLEANGSNTTVAVNGSKEIGPYSSTGNKTITVTCTGGGGSDSDSETLRVKSAPPAAPTLTLTLEPSTIAIGANAKLTWDSTNANSCKLQGSGSLYPSPFSINVDDDGYYWKGPFKNAGQATYVVTCTGSGGTVSKTVTLTVAPATPLAVDLTLGINPISAGAGSTVSWTTTGGISTTACSLNDGLTTRNLGATGSNVAVGPYNTAGSKPITISCTNGSGTTPANDDVSLTVNALTVTPTLGTNPISAGAGSTVSWTTANAITATTCSLNDGVSTRNNLGATGSNVAVGPYTTSGSKTIKVSCNNGPGTATVIGEISLTVNALTVTPTLGTNPISAGAGSTVSWTTTNAITATTCALDDGVATTSNLGATGSNVAVGPYATSGSKTIKVSCNNGPGTATVTGEVSLTVNALTVDLTLGTNPISAGAGSTVSWTTVNAISATTCSLNDGVSTRNNLGATGSNVAVGTYGTSGDKTITISCNNGPGTAMVGDEVLLTVNALPLSVELTLGNNPIDIGTSSTVSWNVTNATLATVCTLNDGLTTTNNLGPIGTNVAVGAYTSTGDKTITISCNNGSSTPTVTDDVLLTVNALPPLSVTLTFSDGSATRSINPGNSTTVNWTITNAVSGPGGTVCSLTEGSAAPTPVPVNPPTGSTPVGFTYAVDSTTLITLACNGPYGATASGNVTLVVNAWPKPMITLTLDTPTIYTNETTGTAAGVIDANEKTVAHWQVADAASCTMTRDTATGPVTTPIGNSGIGDIQLGPYTAGGYIYTSVTCIGYGGIADTVTKTVKLNVIQELCARSRFDTPTILNVWTVNYDVNTGEVIALGAKPFTATVVPANGLLAAGSTLSNIQATGYIVTNSILNLLPRPSTYSAPAQQSTFRIDVIRVLPPFTGLSVELAFLKDCGATS